MDKVVECLHRISFAAQATKARRRPWHSTILQNMDLRPFPQISSLYVERWFLCWVSNLVFQITFRPILNTNSRPHWTTIRRWGKNVGMEWSSPWKLRRLQPRKGKRERGRWLAINFFRWERGSRIITQKSLLSSRLNDACTTRLNLTVTMRVDKTYGMRRTCAGSSNRNTLTYFP